MEPYHLAAPVFPKSGFGMTPEGSLTEKDSSLAGLLQEVKVCRCCALSTARTNAVFGSGSSDSRLIFVGEAPGYHEDQQGLPFVGRAGNLLDELLKRIGLKRGDVYITNVLKCRPPQNRDPQSDEIESCRGFLKKQLSIIRPEVVCTLGNFATRLLSGKPDGITKVHGSTMQFSKAWGDGLLFPVFHPAAALYTPANLETLARDFDSLAALLGLKDSCGNQVNEVSDGPAQEESHGIGETAAAGETPATKKGPDTGESDDRTFQKAGGQLGLF
ncbi:MAG: uracil-DNA glycosylase [Actinomycetota bacterium]